MYEIEFENFVWAKEGGKWLTNFPMRHLHIYKAALEQFGSDKLFIGNAYYGKPDENWNFPLLNGYFGLYLKGEPPCDLSEFWIAV